MSKIELLTPVGRLVQGSLYTGATTDAENRPLVYKTGANVGQPRANFWFSLALEKKQEAHWNQTEWGAKIWGVGQRGFPNGAANAPTFAWKVIDGDSQTPNTQGMPPCGYEGFPGHWILKFSGSFAPSLFNHDGTKPLTEINAIQLGDYIQVYGTIEDNKSSQRPGIYLNHSLAALAGYGQRIIVGADPKTVGFGKSAAPAGMSSTPVGGLVPASPSAPAPTPYPAILNPQAPLPPIVQVTPAPAVTTSPRYEMLPAAQGATYEQLIANGWTESMMVQHQLIRLN